MEEARAAAVIPARYGSTRFPGKPLTLLAGEPMVAHVIRRAREAGCFDAVLVATDDTSIIAAAEAAGAEAVMTGEAASGTDRVAQVVRAVDAEIIVNVQGDEPAVPPANLSLLTAFLRSHPDAELATLALPASPEDLENPAVVKVVCDREGRALYFSRATIPYPRHPVPGIHRKHIGLYGFRRAALLRFASWPEEALERSEGLEQLRALAHGMSIHVLEAAGDSVAVDVPDDVPRAEAALARLRREGTARREQGTGDR